MNNLPDPLPHLLIIGGTASIAEEIINVALTRGFQVTATYRNKLKCNNPKVTWVELDISNINSIINFRNFMCSKKLDLILYLAGELSNLRKNKETYLITNLVNPILVLGDLKNCMRLEQESTFIFMASRSAIYPSFDMYYAVVKSGLVSAIQSLSRDLTKNQKMLSVAPGLIIGSAMYKSMPKTVIDSHQIRSNNSLLNLESLASEVFRIVDNSSMYENGSLIEIGPTYR